MTNVLPLAVLASLFACLPAGAQESPYFVTYDHHLEEPGNLEIESASTVGVPRTGQRAFIAPWLELEYGVLGRWTTELYLEGQSTAGGGAAFTGWRFENRVRPLLREHALNPVLYLEFEDVSEADNILKEIAGHAPDLSTPNFLLRGGRNHELEAKLILSSNVHDWNISENLIFEKNFSANEGLEFGYSLGIARPLARMATAASCRWCRENFSAGVELYGGLGSTHQFGLQDTAHYLAPVLSWRFADAQTLRVSPGFGLTHSSVPLLLRFGYSFEVQGLGRRLSAWLGGRP